MSVNANKLRAIRNQVRERLNSENVHVPKANILTLLVALNVLVRVADADGMSVDEISTLTNAGRLLVDKYEKSYERR